MEQQSKSPTAEPRDELAAAAGQLKRSWEHGKEAAHGVQRVANQSWKDLSAGVDRYVTSRPKTVALGALGAGLVLGYLSGTFSNRCRTAHGETEAEGGRS